MCVAVDNKLFSQPTSDGEKELIQVLLANLKAVLQQGKRAFETMKEGLRRRACKERLCDRKKDRDEETNE